MSNNHSNQNEKNSDIIIELEIIEEIIKDIALNNNKTYKFIELPILFSFSPISFHSPRTISSFF